MEWQLATFGIWELVLILLIVVVIFGAGKLPLLGESLGKAIRNFKGGFKEKPKEIQGEARRVEEGESRGQLPVGETSTESKESAGAEATLDRR
jgi:sec-independent protein translocase protein TatA